MNRWERQHRKLKRQCQSRDMIAKEEMNGSVDIWAGRMAVAPVFI
jgi:hypothetical protein